MYDLLVVGGGLFGSVFARSVADSGYSCLIVEKKDHIGGNCYTKKVEGIDIHMYGPHIFHTNDENIWSWVNRFSEFKPFKFSPVANYKGEMYSLPFNMWTFNKMWGVTNESQAKEKISSQSFQGTPSNLEEQALSMIGKDLYDKLVRGYTKKQWGVDPKELPKSIIKRLPLRFEWDNNYFNDKYQGIPSDGYTKMFERILDHERITVKLNVDYLEGKSHYDSLANHVVYTGPIDRYFDYCYGDLNYRSLKWETDTIDVANYQGCAVMNFTDEETPYTRSIEHKWFNPKGQKRTVISKEFPKKYTRGEEPFYPCYDKESSDRYKKYKSLSDKEKNVIFGGRLAEYKYYDMHQVIASAMKKAELFLQNEFNRRKRT
jgi:UDP-galactopyranose mutase